MIRIASPFDCAKRVDRRVRADVGRVDRAGEQRLDRSRAGVEGLDARALTRSPSASSKSAALHADDRGRVGDVGEVAEAQRRPASSSDCVRAGRDRQGSWRRARCRGRPTIAPSDDRPDAANGGERHSRTSGSGTDRRSGRVPLSVFPTMFVGIGQVRGNLEIDGLLVNRALASEAPHVDHSTHRLRHPGRAGPLARRRRSAHASSTSWPRPPPPRRPSSSRCCPSCGAPASCAPSAARPAATA